MHGGEPTAALAESLGHESVRITRPTPRPWPNVSRAPLSKYGCAAVIAKAKDGKSTAMTHKPGVVLGGEIAYLLDRGFQKFLKTSKLEIAATADRLKAEHNFSDELLEVVGEPVLYNEALGTVSDEYMYDRVKGRDTDAPARGLTPWELTAGAAEGH